MVFRVRCLTSIYKRDMKVTEKMQERKDIGSVIVTSKHKRKCRP